MRSKIAEALSMYSSIFSALLFFFAMSHRCLWASDQAQPTTQGSPRRTKTKWTDDQLYGPYQGMSAKQLWRERDQFFKSGSVPTDSNEVQRLWQWYRAMDNSDPTFRSNTPIEFYGKVEDQHGQSVSEATVDMSWGKGTNCVVKTASDGSFSFTGVNGKFLNIRIRKKNYVSGREGDKSFCYSDFFDEQFHLPNPTNPVIFRLQKLEGPEPMYVWSGTVKLDVTGTVVWVDVGTGEKGASGDIGFSVVRDVFPGERETGYTFAVLVPPGGGVIITNEEFMFHAPVSGYSPQATIQHRPSGPDDQLFHPTMKLKLYLKTVDAMFAAVNLEVGQYQAPEAWMQFVVYFSPSGSHNLELGADNRLDPLKVKPTRVSPACAQRKSAVKGL